MSLIYARNVLMILRIIDDIINSSINFSVRNRRRLPGREVRAQSRPGTHSRVYSLHRMRDNSF